MSVLSILLKSSVELKSAPALETVVLVEVIKTICGLKAHKPDTF